MKTSPEKLAYIKAWREKNWDRWYAKEKLRVSKNRDRILANQARWRDRHIEQKREESRIYSRQYRKLHPEIKAAQERARRFIKNHAMPKWVKRNEILKFYIEAKQKTVATGIPHEVDHIWPLKGSGFVGLHVPWNLRVTTASDNASKKNRRPA